MGEAIEDPAELAEMLQSIIDNPAYAGMLITVDCPKCQHALQVPVQDAAKKLRVKCPQCDQTIQLHLDVAVGGS